MKTSRLLKLSQNFATISRKKDAGFTILELLVIVILLGTLAAIAAPGWLGFINRQRVRTVNDRVLQSLQTAQSEAKRTKTNVTITFSDPSVDPPTVTINGNTQQLNAGGEIKARQVTLTVNTPAAPTTPPNSLVFDYQGNPPTGTTPFYVTVAPFGAPPDTNAKKCVIVQTLIGGIRTDEGNFNATTNQGCR